MEPGDACYIFPSLGRFFAALNGEGKGGYLEGFRNVARHIEQEFRGVQFFFPKSRKVRHRTVDSFLQPVDQFLGGGFKYFLCSSLPGEMIQFD